MRYDYGLWWLVAIHVIWLVVFPLTIYLLTTLLGSLPVPQPFAHMSGNLWASLVLGSTMGTPLMVVGGLLILAGTLSLRIAWRMLYRASGELVTHGPYAVVRHPQYSALFLIIVGALVQWPTIPTLLMAPALIVAYVRLAWREEREMEAQFGAAYWGYRRRVPGFIPALPVPLPGNRSVAGRNELS
ncbi:MAG: methyltransferase family protein [Candidatus Rokuibacteriota bacterium]